MNESPRPRTLLITKNFPPQVGGMERLNWHIADELNASMDVRLVAPRGAGVIAPPGIRTAEARIRPLPVFLLSALWSALNWARSWKPNTVFGGSGLVAPIVWLAAKLAGARSMVYLHGLDITVPSRLYQAVWLPFMRRIDGVVVNSRSTAELARGAGIDARRIGIVNPGTSLPAAPNSEAHDLDARTRASLGDGPILLSVGRLTKRKGIVPFVSEILPAIARDRPSVVFAVVGDAPVHSLHAEAQSPEAIRRAAEAGGVSQHIRFLGKVPEKELLSLYRVADVHVFPVQDLPGDTEGFGMVAVEAAASGLPTVAFDVGGVGDAVADGESGYLVPAGDMRVFADRVLQLLDDPAGRDDWRARAKSFAERFSWAHFREKLLAHIDRTHADDRR